MKQAFGACTVAVLIAAALAAQPTPSETGPLTISPEVWKLYESAIVIDTHDDTPSRMVIEGVDTSKRLPDCAVDVFRLKLKEGGVTGIFFSIPIENRANF